jgi:hypothetical protein
VRSWNIFVALQNILLNYFNRFLRNGENVSVSVNFVVMITSDAFVRRFIFLSFIHRPDDGGSKDLWNVGKSLPDYTALQPRRQPSTYYHAFCKY